MRGEPVWVESVSGVNPCPAVRHFSILYTLPAHAATQMVMMMRGHIFFIGIKVILMDLTSIMIIISISIHTITILKTIVTVV